MATESKALLKQRTQLPGGFVIAETGEKIYLLDKKEGNLYDTIVIGSYAPNPAAFQITAGMQFDFFIGVSAKSKAFTNFKVDKKVPAGWYIAVTKLGMLFLPTIAQTDVEYANIMRIANNSVCNFLKVENSKKEEPPIFWQSGIGWAGHTTANNATFLSASVPSPAAVPNVKVPFSLIPNNDVEAYISFPRNTLPDTSTPARAYAFPEITSAVGVMFVAHGLILKSGVKA
jgi:hypothetical protein